MIDTQKQKHGLLPEQSVSDGVDGFNYGADQDRAQELLATVNTLVCAHTIYMCIFYVYVHLYHMCVYMLYIYYILHM